MKFTSHGSSRASIAPHHFDPRNFIQEHLRRILIVGAIFLALIGALGLAGISHQTSQVWAITHDLQPGQKVTASDLVKVDVNLGESLHRYISASKSFTSKYAVRALGNGELLPANALTDHLQSAPRREISLGILNSDLPQNLAIGDLVDLYLIPRDSQSQSEKISTKLLVIGVDTRSRNIGGSINLLLSLKDSEVIYLTDALTLGRIVVVRNAE